MSKPSLPKQIEQALSEANAEFVRCGKHYVYRLPNHNQVSISKTPSDWRFIQNVLKDIRRATTTNAWKGN